MEVTSPPSGPHDIVMIGRARHLSDEMHWPAVDHRRCNEVGAKEIVDLLFCEAAFDGVEQLVGRDDAAPPHMPTQVCRKMRSKKQLKGSAIILVKTDQHLLLEGGKLRDRP